MKILSTSYINTASFTDPHAWLQRIDFYTGILEQLALEHEVHSIEQIRYTGELQQAGVHYHFLDFGKNVLRFPSRLHQFIKALQPDLVLVNGFIFPLQVMQLRHTLGDRAKILLLHRGEKPVGGFRGALQRHADKCIDGYLFTSAEFGEAWIKAGIISNQEKIFEVIQASSRFAPADQAIVRQALQITAKTVFLWVGRLDANKDPLTVVKAFMAFANTRPDACLYMIFQTTELLASIEALLATDEDAAKCIKLIGAVPHQELQDWYAAADFIVSGSHHEGSGIAVAEAMSCGCIPIVTDILSFRKMTGPDNCGRLYEAGNKQALLEILLQTRYTDVNNEKAKTLQQFAAELSFEAIAGKINNVLDAIQIKQGRS